MSTYVSVTPWIRAIRKDLQDITDDVSLQIGKAVYKAYYVGVSSTPVCTGYARASWQINLNRPATAPAPKKANCSKKRVDVHSSLLGRNLSKSMRAAKRFDITRHKTIFISNTAPYIGDLDKKYGLEGKVSGSLGAAL